MVVTDATNLINVLNTEYWGVKEYEYNNDGTPKLDDNGNHIFGTKNPYEVTETDTTGLVKLGKTLEDYMETGKAAVVDNYVGELIGRISRIVFVARTIDGTVLNMIRTDEEWGEVVEKVRYALGDVEKDVSWNLKRGENYSQDTYYPPDVSVKLYDGMDAFVYPISKTKDQMFSAFINEGEFMGFINGLETSINNAMIVYLSSLEIATLNTFMANILADSTQTQRQVKLLTEFKAEHPSTTIKTPEAAIASKEFLTWMCARIDQDVQDMQIVGTYYNGTDRYPTFTPKEKMSFVLLSTIATRVNSIAKADTFNADFINLPRYQKLPNWQGRKLAGENPTFKGKSTLNIKADGINTGTTENPSSNYTGSYVIGCLYDYDAMGVNLYKRSIDITPYNAKGRFWTEYHRGRGRYFVDTSENGVVYVLA